MRDLYKRLGLNRVTATENSIMQALGVVDLPFEKDREDAENILLNPQKRNVYDRTHRTLSSIGELRAFLDLNGCDFWRDGDYSDFLRPNSKKKKTKKSFFKISPKSLFYAVIISFVVFSIINSNFNNNNNVKEFNSFGSNKENRNNLALTDVKKSNVEEVRKPFYVKPNALNVRKDRSINSEVVGVLKKYETLYISNNEIDRNWIEVTTKGVHGYVSSKYILPGEGAIEKYRDCSKSIIRPNSGKILLKKKTGENKVIINNNPYSDSYIKFKDRNGKTILSAYVRKGEKSNIENFPNGIYKLFYATGSNFSKSCGYFIDDMSASSARNFDVFEITQDGLYEYSTIMEYTLHRVVNGNMRTENVALESFNSD